MRNKAASWYKEYSLQDLTKLPSQTTSSRWQVDKEAIGLSGVQQKGKTWQIETSHTYILKNSWWYEWSI